MTHPLPTGALPGSAHWVWVTPKISPIRAIIHRQEPRCCKVILFLPLHYLHCGDGQFHTIQATLPESILLPSAFLPPPLVRVVSAPVIQCLLRVRPAITRWPRPTSP